MMVRFSQRVFNPERRVADEKVGREKLKGDTVKRLDSSLPLLLLRLAIQHRAAYQTRWTIDKIERKSHNNGTNSVKPEEAKIEAEIYIF